MILLGSVLVLVVVAVLVRRVGGTETLQSAERIYVMLTPLPLLLTIIVPSTVGLVFGFIGRHTIWIHGATWAGVVLSALLGLAGLVLVVRAMRRGTRWGWPLGASVVLAAMPFTVLAVGVALLSTTWR